MQTVLLAKRVLPYLSGSVHAQTSPSVGYSVEGTINEARRIITTFEELNVPRERVCIKIPITPEGAQACKILQDEGIQTLGTCIFGVEQAIAASLAGCVYLAPYFNGKDDTYLQWPHLNGSFVNRTACAFRRRTMESIQSGREGRGTSND